MRAPARPQLKKKIAQQQREVARLNSLQRGLTKDIAATRTELKSLNADLVTVKKRITRMKERIEEVKAAYAALVARGEELDAELTQLTSEEADKAASLADRKDELAAAHPERLRHRPDLAARDVPVRWLLHRHPRRGELHDRRGRAGQGARPADRT